MLPDMMPCKGVLVRILQRKRTIKICYKELAHTITEADKSQDVQDELASWGPRRAQCPSLIAVKQNEICLFLTQERVSLFVLFRPSTDWMKPTHLREDNLLYSVH